MSTTSFFVLFESASGWGLFSVLEAEEIGALIGDVSIVVFVVLLSCYLCYRTKMVFKTSPSFPE
jgi:hypothetical protein